MSLDNGNKTQLFSKKEECCGCAACCNVCPVSAITMEEDYEGFLYPEVNMEQCIKCNKCLQVCPFKTTQ